MQDIFSVLEQFFKKEEAIDIAKLSKSNGFVITRILSSNMYSFWSAVEANNRTGLPLWALIYLFWYHIPTIETKPRFYFPKMKKTKKEKIRRMVQQQFNCSDYHSEQVMSLLKKQGINIEERFGEMTNVK